MDKTNSINIEKTLEVGDYYAINTLTFATKDKDSFWRLRDKDKMSTVNLQPLNRFSPWCILSYSWELFSPPCKICETLAHHNSQPPAKLFISLPHHPK